jgi:MazG family protein
MPPENLQAPLDDLAAIVARLHAPAPDGCPWCLDQTQESLADELLKEAYEVADAVRRGDNADVCGELGDVLLTLVGMAHLAASSGGFTLAEVLSRIIGKVVRRHPHIFGDARASTPDEALRNWDAAKREERGADRSILEGIPPALPALLRAEEMQRRAARVGFDWPKVDEVLAKVREEIGELVAAPPGPRQTEEFGDLLFALANVARWLGFPAERALQEGNDKFARRFAAIEQACRKRGVRPEELSLEELDALWNAAKAAEVPSPLDGEG